MPDPFRYVAASHVGGNAKKCGNLTHIQIELVHDLSENVELTPLVSMCYWIIELSCGSGMLRAS